MRCNNCGWDNPSGHTKCEKCASALGGAQQQPAPPASAPPPRFMTPQPSSEQPAAGASDNPAFAGATFIGKKAEMPAWDSHNPEPKSGASEKAPGAQASPPRPVTPPSQPERGRTTQEQGIVVCPNQTCKYPNVDNAQECVSCGTSLVGIPPMGRAGRETELAREQLKPTIADRPAQKMPEPEPEKPRPVTPLERRQTPAKPEPQQAPRNVPAGGTMNPWSKAKANHFTLRPVSREGENLNVRLDFEGNAVELNRANLEPTNLTITSKVQAVVEYRDGAWYLRNESAMGTTFVKVEGEMRIEKGDVLLFGDRMFEFDAS